MSKKGFTLIELLVVIAIIGILAILIIVALARARQSARNAQRKAKINDIALAEEMYQDQNNTYADIGVLVGDGLLQEPDGSPQAASNYTVSNVTGSTFCATVDDFELGVSFHCDEQGCTDGAGCGP